MRQGLTMALAAGVALAFAAAASAAPIAPTPPLSKDGKQFYGYMHKSPPPCPDAAVVGVPAYPGSVCIGTMQDQTPGAPASQRMYPRVVLVSTAPLATVAAWYKAHLARNWVYNPQMKNFAPPGWSFARSMRMTSVALRPVDKMHPVFGAAFYNAGPVRTSITILYKPKG